MQKDFSALSLHPQLLSVLNELKFDHMTPIQGEAIPQALQGRDVIGQAKTGSGKTVAFSLPILNQIAGQIANLQKEPVLKALVLCPTRELCAQVEREIRRLGRKLIGLRVISLSGGQLMGPQFAALEKGIHIAVGTPGRVLDHLKKRSLDLSTLNTLVLDEADRMLDMGFQEEMREILDQAPSTRQTLLFSATFPPAIEKMSRQYQKDAVFISVKSDEKDETPNIEQSYFLLDIPQQPDEVANEKLDALLYLLGRHKPESCIIFVNFKVNAVYLHEALRGYGISAATLHGDQEQPVRDSVMAQFRNRSIRVLIATDVAARGLDVEKLDLVVNFDLPIKIENYVHRIGRTGRAGETGKAVSLVTIREKNRLERIEQETKSKLNQLPESLFKSVAFEDLKREARIEARMGTLFIASGRKNKMRPGDILGALTGEAGGLKAEDIGKIEIHDFFSYVAVARPVIKLALQRLRDGRIKGKKQRVELAK